MMTTTTPTAAAWLALCLALVAAAPLPAHAGCMLRTGLILGSHNVTFAHMAAASPAECCALCQKNDSCAVFTFEPPSGAAAAAAAAGSCFLKSEADAVRVQDGSVSGYSRGGGSTSVALKLDTRAAVHVTDPLFKSWNIDAS